MTTPTPSPAPRSIALRVACEELIQHGFDAYDRIARRLGGGLWLQLGIIGGSVYALSDPFFETMDAAGWSVPSVTLNARPSRAQAAQPGAFILRTSDTDDDATGAPAAISPIH